MTLRHSIVFSGKRFEDRRLLAADALVITLLHLRDSPVGREWQRRALELPRRVADRWNMYPPDGRVASSQLYEFQFRPISIHDVASLGLAYGLIILYLLMSLSKLRAVKSKFGLIVTIVTQIVFSTMSSFTVCAIFKIDLSRIPRDAYPLVILSMSLEHIFRLINAVILKPPEDSVSNRIGQALGETAPTALASSIQSVLILAGLSRLVSPGVSAFCVFAAVAIVFDFFYLSTFFLAVFSVDVRRLELGDALAKASMRHNRGTRSGRRSWWDQVLQGKIAMSTRIAGTFVMFGFVLIAQWHFFGGEGLFRELLRLCRGGDAANRGPGPSRASLLEDINQARSPMSWLQMQDHETAREVIKTIKSSSHSYVARVYDPFVFVLKDSDRVLRSKEPALLPAVYDFAKHELPRFVIFIVTIAALRLLTNFLLWEDEQSVVDEHDPDEAPLLSIKSMARGHRMDVILMTASAGGHVVSVSLDCTIWVWSIRGMGTSYVVAKGDGAAATLFPVIAMAIDQRSQWLALLSQPKRAAHARASFWHLAERAWGPCVEADSCRARPVAFFLDPSAPCGELRVLVVHQSGTLTEIWAGEATERQAVIFPWQLTCARLVGRKAEHGDPASQPVIMAMSRQGEVYMASREGAAWLSRRAAIDDLGESGAHYIELLPALGLFVVAAGDCVHLVSAEDGKDDGQTSQVRIFVPPAVAARIHRPDVVDAGLRRG